MTKKIDFAPETLNYFGILIKLHIFEAPCLLNQASNSFIKQLREVTNRTRIVTS